MAGTQAELLQIAEDVLLREPVVQVEGLGNLSQVFWEHTDAAVFNPGLALKAWFRGTRRMSLDTLLAVDFITVEPDDASEASLHVPVWPPDRRIRTERPFDELILGAFQQYMRRPNPDLPVGFSDNYIDRRQTCSARPDLDTSDVVVQIRRQGKPRQYAMYGVAREVLTNQTPGRGLISALAALATPMGGV
jgi:hypothetical protein